jgi:tripartite-type tricarboxylate transporter receptor subunit TctC
MMFVGLSQALPFMKSGKLRALAMGGAQRAAALPELPTLTESGYAVDASGWYGVLAPRNTPRPITAKLHGILTQVLNEPQVMQRLNDNALVPAPSTPEQFAAFLRTEVDTWRKVVNAAGLKNKSNL